MCGAGGCDGGTVGVAVWDGTAGPVGFTSVGVFAAPGRTGFNSKGGGGAGSICEGVLTGASGAGDTTLGAGSCGFCTGVSGFVSEEGNDIVAGSLIDVGTSTRGAGIDVSRRVVAACDRATGGRSNGFSAAGAGGWTTTENCRLRSASSRWKEVCCRAFSSLSRSISERSLLYLTRRMRAIMGVAIRKIPIKKTSSSTMGIGRPWECVFLSVHVRTTRGKNLAICFPNGSAGNSLLRKRF